MKIRLIPVIAFLFYSVFSFAQLADVDEGCTPLTVNFTAPAGPITWFWDFKDGGTSPNQNPPHTFTNPGTYIVEFKETAIGPLIASDTIKVYAKPIITLVNNPDKGCVPLPISFTASIPNLPLGVAVNNYTWAYGDFSGESTTDSTSNHTYTTAGSMDISVGISTSAPTCDVTTTFPGRVNTSNPPFASFTPTPPSGCTTPLTVNFTNNSTPGSLSYSWVLDGGSPITSEVPPAQVYTTDGDYTVALTVTDTNNCSDDTVQVVSVGSPVSDFTVADTACINSPTLFTNTSTTGSYFWTFDADANIPTSGTKNPTIQYSTAGTHTVTLRTSAGGCFHDTTKTLFVQEPAATFTSTPSYSCQTSQDFTFTGSSSQSVASWNWKYDVVPNVDELGGITVQTAGNVNVNTVIIGNKEYDEKGVRLAFTHTLSMTTTAGCTSPFQNIPDTVFAPWARFMPDVYEGCAPLTVTFSDSSRAGEDIVSYTYNYGDGTPPNTLLTDADHTHTFTTAGTYSVNLTIVTAAGCSDTSYNIVIDVGEQKALSFTADNLNVCPGDTVTFTNTSADKTGFDAWNYSSNSEFLSHCFQNDAPKVVFNDSIGQQTIIFTGEYNGCQSKDTLINYINVSGPIADFTFLQDCSTPFGEVQFTDKSLDATSVSWDFGDGTGPSAATGTFTHTYAAVGDYKVVLTATKAGCNPTKDSTIIRIRNIQASFTADTTACKNIFNNFNASASVDVDERCNTGYTWIFSDPNKRPITTSASNTFIDLDTTTNVSLIVNDINGCKDTASRKVRISELTANYIIDDTDNSICFPDTLTFTSGSSTSDTTLANWLWYYNWGATLPETRTDSVPHEFTYAFPITTPTFSVTLIIQDVIGCVDTATKVLSTYKPISDTSFTPSPPNICLGDSIIFSANDFTSKGSNLIFDWNFGNGVSAQGNNISYTYPAANTYSGKLIYTEASSGCKDSIPFTTSVQNYPVVGLASDPNIDNPICFNDNIIRFWDTTKVGGVPATTFNTTASWYIDNIFKVNDSTFNPNEFPKGTYSIKLKSSTTNGCADSVVKSINVIGPEGDYSFSRNNICKGDSVLFTLNQSDTADIVDYFWDFGDGSPNVLNTDSVWHQYNFLPPSGNTVAKLVMNTTTPCPDNVDTTINIWYVKADFTRNNDIAADTAICLGDNTFVNNLSSPASDTYEWSMGDGTSYSNSGTFNHTYAVADSFDIQLIASRAAVGCLDTMVKRMIVYNLPAATAIGDKVCKFDTAFLSVAEGYSAINKYLWTPGAELNDDTLHNPVIPNALNSNTYTVRVTDTSNCVSTSSAFVHVVQPLVPINFDTTIVVGDSIQLPLVKQNEQVVFYWISDSAGVSCTQCDYPTIQPLGDQVSYEVLLKDSCTEATALLNVKVRPEMFIDLPTTFTPNGDGNNDIIYIKGWGIKELISFEVYNRWGELVFETADLNEGWNGYYKGLLQNNDTYAFKVKALTWRDTEVFKEGHFNLMR